jgi:hypothetical protein
MSWSSDVIELLMLEGVHTYLCGLDQASLKTLQNKFKMTLNNLKYNLK